MKNQESPARQEEGRLAALRGERKNDKQERASGDL